MIVRRIDEERKADIRLPNEPFPVFGRLLPVYRAGIWSHREKIFPPEERSETTFPEEEYDFAAMAADHVFIGAYEEERCVGLAVWRREWHRYLYLHDLKVSAPFRGKGVGRALIEAGADLARETGRRGLMTVAQDNNLAACRFYLRQGFVIGGFDDHIYNGTKLEGTGDVYFYRETDPADAV